MALPNTSAVIAARNNNELRARATAVAAALGIKDPQSFIEIRAWELAAAPVDDAGNTVASMYEFELAEYRKKKSELEQELADLKAPGTDAAVLTDEQLKHAVEHLNNQATATDGSPA